MIPFALYASFVYTSDRVAPEAVVAPRFSHCSCRGDDRLADRQTDKTCPRGPGAMIDRKKRLWQPLGMPRAARITPASRDGVDLLTVLAHELGHLLGHADDYDDIESTVMGFALPLGVRRLTLPVVEVRSGATAGEGENQVVEALWAPADNVRGLAKRDDRTSAGTRADAGLAALLAEQPAAWLAADEDLARLPATPRKHVDAAQQRLDDVLSSVGDWLDPLDEVLNFVKPSR